MGFFFGERISLGEVLENSVVKAFLDVSEAFEVTLDLVEFCGKCRWVGVI